MTGPAYSDHPEAHLRSVHHVEFDADDLVSSKGTRTVSVVIPARDEETTIGDIVVAIRRALVDETPLVDEILVVDDRSVDSTRSAAINAGARVVSSNDVLRNEPPVAGKGGALWKGVAAAGGDVLAFVDGDVVDFDPRFIVGLLGPLLSAGEQVAFVKGFYERPLDGRARGGGRVTELVARPLLTILFPELAPLVQPLAGEFAAARSTLERLPFVEGYGVDIALLIDVVRAYGIDSIVQVDLGRRVHRNRPLHELGPMATEVLIAALGRAGQIVPSSVYLNAPEHPAAVRHTERRPLRDVADYRSPRDR